MNRAVSNIAKRISQLQISQGLNGLPSVEKVDCGTLDISYVQVKNFNYGHSVNFRDNSQLPTTSHCIIGAKTGASAISSASTNFADGDSYISEDWIWPVKNMTPPFMENYSIKLPTANNIISTIYTFPSLQKEVLYAPTITWKRLLEINDFNVSDKILIEDPHLPTKSPMYADIRVLTIRRHKMNKHKRRKREKRDRFQLMKYHREQKAKSEQLFQKRMQDKMAELRSFNAEMYIRDVIKRAKRDWRTELVPSGRKKLPHWSTLMSLEELYDLEPDDYIKKTYGIPNDEDKAHLLKLKEKYYKEFLGEVEEKGLDIDKVDEKTKT